MSEREQSTQFHPATAPAVCATGGALATISVLAATGTSCAGVAGSGGEIVAATGPLGIVVGALIGLAAYAVGRVVGDVRERGVVVAEADPAREHERI